MALGGLAVVCNFLSIATIEIYCTTVIGTSEQELCHTLDTLTMTISVIQESLHKNFLDAKQHFAFFVFQPSMFKIKVLSSYIYVTLLSMFFSRNFNTFRGRKASLYYWPRYTSQLHVQSFLLMRKPEKLMSLYWLLYKKESPQPLHSTQIWSPTSSGVMRDIEAESRSSSEPALR